MITKNKYTVLLLLVLVFLFSACQKDFGDLNENPNTPGTPNTKFLFASAITGLGGGFNGAAGLLYVQHMAEYIYTQESRYFNTQFNYNGIYAGPLMDLQRIINLNTDENTKATKVVLDNGSNKNQIAYATILKCFYMLHITDRWGDVPYTEAFQSVENTHPKFDAQRSIYNDLLVQLKTSANDIDGAMPNDALFNGDVEKWIKFANSLRLIIDLRMSKTEDAALARADFADALDAGVITSNSDNVIYSYLANATYESPWYTNYVRQGRIDYGVSQTVVDDFLVPEQDPRLPVFSRTLPNGSYAGIPYGVSEQFAAGSDGALLGTAIYAQNFPLQLVTYAQICFTLAEAALIDWIPGGKPTALDWYIKGIDASMDQWSAVSTNPKISITTGQKATYEAQPAIAFTPSDSDAEILEKIQTQKWINFYMSNGYEAWAEWRRTGYPVLAPAPEALNADGQIPRRQCYPKTEPDLNKENYDAVIAAQGPDELSTRIWWDKE